MGSNCEAYTAESALQAGWTRPALNDEQDSSSDSSRYLGERMLRNLWSALLIVWWVCLVVNILAVINAVHFLSLVPSLS